MPANMLLELRDEFRQPHLRGTAIERHTPHGADWAQKDPTERLRIPFPAGDVQRLLFVVSTLAQEWPLVFWASAMKTDHCADKSRHRSIYPDPLSFRMMVDSVRPANRP